MKFGVMLPISGSCVGRDPIISTALKAEELGFNSVWSPDETFKGREGFRYHITCGSAEDIDENSLPVFYEPLTTLSYLAGKTQSVELGTSIFILPLSNPIWVAKQVANIDDLSNGRFILGVGIGGTSSYARTSFESLNVPYGKKGEINDEYIRAIRTLWEEKVASFEGKYVRFKNVEMYPRPKRPRLWIGSFTNKAGLRRAATLGDGWCAPLVSPEDMEHALGEIMRIRKENGKTGSFDVSTVNYVCLAEDREHAERISQVSFKARLDRGGYDAPRPFDTAGRSLLGNSKDISGGIEKLVKAGVEHLILMFIFRGSITKMHEEMATLAREVIPTFT